MGISWGAGAKTLEDFIEDDLAFLIKSHYQDTVALLEKKLANSEIALVDAISRYPNLLLKLNYQLFFWFAQQMSTVNSTENSDFYNHYCRVARAYQVDYINGFVDKQGFLIQEHSVSTQQSLL